MMMSLAGIREYIASLGVAEDSNVYIGKMDNKKQCSIGVYNRRQDGDPYVALGGLECTTYGIRTVSILIHWNKNPVETEKAAYRLFEKLQTDVEPCIGGLQVDFLRLMVPEPQDVGTDESGVYEYVIWLNIYYRRNIHG